MRSFIRDNLSLNDITKKYLRKLSKFDTNQFLRIFTN